MKSQRINSHTYPGAPTIGLNCLLEVSCNYVIAMPPVTVAVAILLEFEIMREAMCKAAHNYWRSNTTVRQYKIGMPI